MDLVLLGWALGVGLVQGFLHCAGMCGPFVLSFSVAASTPNTSLERPAAAAMWQLQGVHNAGRVLSFAVLGGVFGAMGSFVNTVARIAGLQTAAGIIGGTFMILWAIEQWRTGHGGALFERFSLLRIAPLSRLLSKLARTSDLPAAFLSGAILGFHPCGLLFAVLLSAAASGSWLHGFTALLAFGLGTVPALLIVAAAGWYGRRRFSQRRFSHMAAVLMAVSGLLFTLRGLANNGWIPSVNPWLF